MFTFFSEARGPKKLKLLSKGVTYLIREVGHQGSRASGKWGIREVGHQDEVVVWQIVSILGICLLGKICCVSNKITLISFEY